MKINGRNYTSNLTKFLKHLDKVQAIQDGKGVAPVMVHLSLTAACNLSCSYCCYENRDKKESLSLEKVLSVIDQFAELGVKGYELTGSGEPTLHKDINLIIKHIKRVGGTVGLITNGTNPNAIADYSLIEWMRVSSHVLSGNNQKLKDNFAETVKRAKAAGVDVGSVYIHSGNDKDIKLKDVVNYVEEHKLPTRITPDLTKSVDWANSEMSRISGLLKTWNSEYCFVSDFNNNFRRSNENCFAYMIKPFVHTDGFVYACPSICFNPESYKGVNPKFRVCSIDDILTTYRNMTNVPKQFDCSKCKYASQNDFLTEVVRETKHNDFA